MCDDGDMCTEYFLHVAFELDAIIQKLFTLHAYCGAHHQAD